ncbi:MAG: DUF3750 domain-containing protein [Hyphomicrobiaceae bacterium]
MIVRAVVPSFATKPGYCLCMWRAIVTAFLVLFLAPVATHGVWWHMQPHPQSYVYADWSSAGVLPAARSSPEAVVHVMAGRTGRWKGIFAHHTWLIVKPKGASAYSRYDVVGWGTALRTDAYPPDGRWFGNEPTILLTLRGDAADRAIPRIRQAVAAYPHAKRGAYVVWPGPNSNTFVAAVAREVPELAPALLPTAIGKDFVIWPVYLGATPSRTGLQLSVGGVLGVAIGWVEGVEINVLGLVAGIDVRRPALKLPGWGRLGWAMIP